MNRMTGENRNLIAVETDNGVLLFSNTPLGIAGFKAYMQFLSDRFFESDYTKKIDVYLKMNGGDDVSFFYHSDSCLSRDFVIFRNSDQLEKWNNFFDFSLPDFLPHSITEGFSLIYSCSVSPNPKVYRSFVDKFGIRDSERAVNINTLWDIYENGFRAKLPLENNPKFIYGNIFDIIYGTNLPFFLNGLMCNVYESAVLENDVKQVAKLLLKDFYKIEITSEPACEISKLSVAKEILPKKYKLKN